MSVISQMIGEAPLLRETTTAGGVPTVMSGAALVNIPAQRPPLERRRRRRRVREADDSIIPDGAEKVTGIEGEEPEDAEFTVSPTTSLDYLSTGLALVAPDVTPDALRLLDPSDVPPPAPRVAAPVPSADPALNVILGKPAAPTAEPGSPKTTATTLTLPGIPPISSLGDSIAEDMTGTAVTAGVLPQGPMPDPAPAKTFDSMMGVMGKFMTK